MNSIDIALISLLVISALYSMYRGFVKELFSLLALILGYLIASGTYLKFINFSGNILNISLPPWAGFLVVFASSWLLVSLVGKFVSNVISISVTLKLVDRISGSVMGLLKGVAFISICLISLSSFSFTDVLIKKSVVVPYVTGTFGMLTSLSSSDLVKQFEKKLSDIPQEMKKKMNEFKTGVPKGAKDMISEEDKRKMNKLLTGMLKENGK
ncbi:MAG: CvpA family protein [Nitrospinota bacterium]